MSLFSERPGAPAGPLDLVLPRPSRRPRGPSRRQRRSAAIATLATLACALSLHAGVQAEQRQREWGADVPVWVTSRALRQGTTIDAADVERQVHPPVAVPAGAWPGDESPPVGRAALVDLVAGETLLVSRLAPEGLSGPVALVGNDRVAVALPIDVPLAGLAVGSTLVLFVPDPSTTWSAPSATDGPPPSSRPTPGRGSAHIVSDDALVVAVEIDSVTVSVTTTDAAAVVAALAVGPVIPALTGR